MHINRVKFAAMAQSSRALPTPRSELQEQYGLTSTSLFGNNNNNRRYNRSAAVAVLTGENNSPPAINAAAAATALNDGSHIAQAADNPL